MANNFWKNELIIKTNKDIDREGPFCDLEVLKNDQITKLPKNFDWKEYNIEKTEERKKIINFLNKNNEVDEIYDIIFDELLKWEFNKPDFLLGVENITTGDLIGLIIAKKITLRIKIQTLDFLKINNLCVDKKYRNKRLVPVLVKELKRRAVIKNIHYGLFKSNFPIGKELVSVQYLNRIINLESLLTFGLSKIEKNIRKKEMKTTLKLSYSLNSNFKKMESTHLDECYDLYNENIQKNNIYQIFTKDEFNKIMTNKNVVAYIIEEEGVVIDFISYFNTFIGRKNIETRIKKGNLFLYSTTCETIYTLLKNLLLICKENSVDLFSINSLGISDYSNILYDLNFEEYPEKENIFLYNYKLREIKNNQINIVI